MKEGQGGAPSGVLTDLVGGWGRLREHKDQRARQKRMPFEPGLNINILSTPACSPQAPGSLVRRTVPSRQNTEAGSPVEMSLQSLSLHSAELSVPESCFSPLVGGGLSPALLEARIWAALDGAACLTRSVTQTGFSPYLIGSWGNSAYAEDTRIQKTKDNNNNQQVLRVCIDTESRLVVARVETRGTVRKR